MKVGNGQKLSHPLLEPLLFGHNLAFRAMAVAAGVIGDSFVVAVAASFDMAAQDSGPARLDGAHHFEMVQGQVVPGAVDGAMLAKDSGQFQGWLPRHGSALARILPRPSGASLQLRQIVERRSGGRDLSHTDAGIAGGRVDAAVSEQHLNDANVLAVFQQMGGKAMAESMGGDSFVDAGQTSRFAADLLNGRGGDVPLVFDGGKQPCVLVGGVLIAAVETEVMWPLAAAVFAQHSEQAWG